MKKYWVKNIIIAVLGILLVYQTGMLWFGKNIGQVVFYNLKNAVAMGSIFSMQEGEGRNLFPEAVIAGYGDKLYRVIRSEESYKEISESMEKAMEGLWEKGSFEGICDADWNSILESKCVMYKFPAELSSREYFGRLGKKASDFFSKNIENFDYFVITATSSGSSHLDFYFVDSNVGLCGKYVLEDNEIAADMYNESENFRDEVSRTIPHISTMENGFKLFKGNVFIPEWSEGEYFYDIVSSKNPFYENGQFSSALLSDYTDVFFDNFSVKRGTKDLYTGVYVFSDEDIVVKYYKNGLLEYFDYDSGASSEQNVFTAMKSAAEFIEKDKTLSTGYFLTDIKSKSEGLVFYFDYEVREFPVELSEEIKKETGLESAIEVTVKNNSVKKYRRYMYNFEATRNVSLMNTDFTYAMDNAVNRHMEAGLLVEPEELYLGYCADGTDIIFMNWYARISGIKYKCETFSVGS